MAQQGDSLEPFRMIELPDGSDPISKEAIQRIRSNEGEMTVEVAIDGLSKDLTERIVEQVRGAALALSDADHVRIESVRDADKDIELPDADHVLAVASAKGGVGKTTVGVAIARTLTARGVNVGLFDTDIYGPNVPPPARGCRRAGPDE